MTPAKLGLLVLLGALSAGLLQAPAVAQPDGSAAAAQRVTLAARPTTLAWSQSATLFGAVDSGQEGQTVTIEAKDCPLTSFREVTVVQTSEGGTFTLSLGAGVNTVIRAVWRSGVSAPIQLRQVPRIFLDRRGPGRFEIGVSSKGQMWRKRVLFQRRAGSKWVTVKTVTLTDTLGGVGQAFVWTEAEFGASVPRGSIVRALLPSIQARPCYLGGVSNTVRT
jgi:hypothetical protein